MGRGKEGGEGVGPEEAERARVHVRVRECA